MEEKPKSAFELAVLDLCKKARVKSPFALIGKKIKICYFQDFKNFTVFDSIAKVMIANHHSEEIKSFAYIYLDGRANGGLFVLSYSWPEGRWTFDEYDPAKKATKFICFVEISFRD